MKAKIHPDYDVCTVSCACGNSFETRSTVGDIHVEICSNCHPFFTGKQKLIDTAGRVEKYMKKYKLDEKKTAKKAAKQETELAATQEAEPAAKEESKPEAKQEAKPEEKPEAKKEEKPEAKQEEKQEEKQADKAS